MRIVPSCAACLLDRQIAKVNRIKDAAPAKKEAYIAEVKSLLENRTESDCAPYMVSRFNHLYAAYFGEEASFAEVKKEYNDLVLSMEKDLERELLGGEDMAKDEEAKKACLKKALLYARTGNYIDFGAMNQVDKDTFLSLFARTDFRKEDEPVLDAFYEECKKAKRFLLLADNCGEIVLDKLLLRMLKRCFPQLTMQVLVRGGEVLNDATMEDALYVGLSAEAEVLANGTDIAGTCYDRINEAARRALDEADVVLSKGQGNYESLAGMGRHIYYLFLCKCDLFIRCFDVPKLTGIFVAE